MGELAYADRKEQGRCVSRGCGRRRWGDSQLCQKHDAAKKRSRRAWIARRRDERRAKGLCIWCPSSTPGGPNRASSATSTACLACKIARRRLPVPVEGVGQVVDSSRAERIARMTRTHEDGRTRYHGQGKRGNQPQAQLNRQDLEWARAALDAGEAGLRELESAEVKAMGRIQREGVKSAALHQLNRATGHVDDVLARMGHFKMRHGRRDGE